MPESEAHKCQENPSAPAPILVAAGWLTVGTATNISGSLSAITTNTSEIPTPTNVTAEHGGKFVRVISRRIRFVSNVRAKVG